MSLINELGYKNSIKITLKTHKRCLNLLSTSVIFMQLTFRFKRSAVTVGFYLVSRTVHGRMRLLTRHLLSVDGMLGTDPSDLNKMYFLHLKSSVAINVNT